MTEQLTLFNQREIGAHVVETPVVGRITFAQHPLPEMRRTRSGRMANVWRIA